MRNVGHNDEVFVMFESNENFSSESSDSKTMRYEWNDSNWLLYRKKLLQDKDRMPLNLYEIDLGTWRSVRNSGRGEEKSSSEYCAISNELIPYAKEMGYTHVVLLEDFSSFTCDSYPGRRFCSEREFAEFIDRLHSAGIGVVLDGINANKTCSSERDYLEFKENIHNMIINYHIDGLRGDVPSSNEKDFSSSEFSKRMNSELSEEFPDVFTIGAVFDSETFAIAEDYRFDFIQDSLTVGNFIEYSSYDPIFRRYGHNLITCSGSPPSRRTVLAVSHSDVSGEKCSLMNKMFGCYEDKFAGVRNIVCHINAFSSKKSFFMGCEFGQFREWDGIHPLEWFMLDYDMHRKLKSFFEDINDLYLRIPEFSKGCFRWINADDSDRNIVSYVRGSGRESVICVINFSGIDVANYRVYVDFSGTYDVLLNTDDLKYGGRGTSGMSSVHTDTDSDGKFYLSLNMPRLGGVYLKRRNRRNKLNSI